MMAFPKIAPRKRQPDPTRDDKHLALIRLCQCVTCLSEPAEAAHVRYGDAARGKSITGMGTKPADRWTVPLCAECHRNGPGAQHSMGERAFWESHRIDPLALAEELYRISTTCRGRRLDRGLTVNLMKQVIRRNHRRKIGHDN
jgi:hypothetical protein